MSLASVLVMSVNGRRFSLKVFASASAAALRFLPSTSCRKLSVGSMASVLPPTLNRRLADRLVEQPVPGRIAGHRLLVEELLDPVLELIGLFLAHVLDPGPVVAERGIAHRGLQLRVIDAVELEREKQKMQRRRRDALLHVAVKLRARRIGGIAGIHQRCIGHQPAKPVVDRFIARHRFRKRRSPVRGKRREPALEILLESRALAVGQLQVALHLGAVEPRIEIIEIPLRQFAGLRSSIQCFSGRGLGHDRQSFP